MKVSCNSGYRLTKDSSRIRQCETSLTWSGNSTCIPISCMKLSPPLNGNVNVSKETYLGNATYSCNYGYRPSSGNITQYCVEAESPELDATGIWSGQPLQCAPISCPVPDLPNGTISSGNYTLNSSVRFSCNQGFHLRGAVRAHCEPSGRWSAPLPTCEGKISPAEMETTFRREHNPKLLVKPYDFSYFFFLSGNLTRVREGSKKDVWYSLGVRKMSTADSQESFLQPITSSSI